jgi:GNAT superfamily N-acetyltransferase
VVKKKGDIEERTVRIYEYVPQEVDEVLAFRNKIFGHVSRAHWEAMNCTAVVTREDDELVGFIPLQFREQVLRPGVTVPVVYENAVGVAEGVRGQGIGSQMLDEAAQLMSERVDALMVIRGGEQSEGYRFYRRTGHGDVMYARNYYLSLEDTCPLVDEARISLLDRARWLALEPQLLALYERRYGHFGGGRRRMPGYWQMILDSHVYRAHKWWLLSLTDDAGRLAGYLVAAQGLWDGSPDVFIYEVVGEDDDAVEHLICYARRFTSEGRYGAAYVSLANPVRPVLRRLGFGELTSTPHVMARILRPDRIFQRLAAGSDLRDTLFLAVSTPHRALVVNDPPSPRYIVRIETKENLLSRLFCCRLDFEAALDMELVRWNGYDPGLRRALGQVFAFSEWVQWFTDYV